MSADGQRDAPVSRPRIVADGSTAGFWNAAAEHRLVVQRCESCGLHRHYPQPRCAECLSEEWSWAEVSGRGTVYTFTVTYQAFHPFWGDRIPYAVATIELDEGVRVVSDLPSGDERTIAIGARVEVFFEDGTDEHDAPVTFPRFRLT